MMEDVWRAMNDGDDAADDDVDDDDGDDSDGRGYMTMLRMKTTMLMTMVAMMT